MAEFDWNSDDVLSIVTGGAKKTPEASGEAPTPAEAVPDSPAETEAAALPQSVLGAADSGLTGLTVPEQTHEPETPAAADEIREPEDPTPADETREPETPAAADETVLPAMSGDQPEPGSTVGQPEPIPGPQPVRPAVGAEKPRPVQPVQEKRAGGFGKKIVALALVFALLGSLLGAGGFYLATRLFGSASGSSGRNSSSGKVVSLQQGAPRDTNAVQTVQVERGQLMTASQVYKTNVNSTVGITTEITTTNYWGYQSTAAAAGSGFILTEDGYILTNQHVIDSANSITVAMYDGTTYAAELIGYDGNNDIAVLKIDAKGLTPVTLGDSDKLEVGDEVIAIGNPLGELTFSLTKGNVSALNRAVTLSSKVTMSLIQTDAAINSGNSGGALFNMYGEVVGITNAKYSSSGFSNEASIDNIGFAIPINSVREIVTSIIEKGYISKPYIGVSVANVSEESQNYGMPKGAAIRSVEADSPAAKGGLQENDIVTAVNGTEITSYEEFAQIISDSGIGAELELSVYRKGETLTLKVTVGEKIQQALPDASQQNAGGQSGENANPQGGSGSDGQGSDPWGGSFPWGWGFGW